jgi:succinate dehydrogenase/fumarate reductase flavoprotein subunit
MRDTITNEYEGKIEIRCGMNVTKLLHQIDDAGVKTVTGVEVNGSETITADAVILATGGFGCCQRKDGLMSRFRPDVSVSYFIKLSNLVLA